MHLENGNIRDLAELQVQVTVMASYDIISLINQLKVDCSAGPFFNIFPFFCVNNLLTGTAEASVKWSSLTRVSH